MKRYLHKIEHFVDKSIPFWLLLLLVIIIIEFFFHDIAEHYNTLIEWADILIISFFVVDLAFKYNHVRNVKRFLKEYWLDVIAVFPFFLFFRVFEEVAKLIGEAREIPLQFQKVVHAGLEIKEARLASEAAKLGREAEGVAKLTRAEKFARFIRPVARSPRIVKSIAFYEDPKHRKTLEKGLKKVEKGVVKVEKAFKKDFELVEKKGAKVFKEVKSGLKDGRRRSHPAKNQRKNVRRKVRSVNRQKGARLKARKRV